MALCKLLVSSQLRANIRQRPLDLARPWWCLTVRSLADAPAAPVVHSPPSSLEATTKRPAATVIRPSSFRENQEQVGLTERQEGIMLEKLPSDWTEFDICKQLLVNGVDLGDSGSDKILLMRSRLGKSIGRALVAVSEHVPHIRAGFPKGVTYRPVDRYDIEGFVEQCERFLRFSDDLRMLARPENFLRTITITEVPSSYGRQDIVHVMKTHCDVTVAPQDVVFRFKRWGRQSDTCFVVCPDMQAADHCIAQIQELAVPKRAAYGSLFGATFLWSARSTLFLCDSALDFAVHDSKFCVFTTGWQEDMDAEEFKAIMEQMKFYPVRNKKHHMEADQSSGFFMYFDSMRWTKKVMVRLQRLKRRWQMKQQTPFFAYPRRVDVYREGEDKYEDADSDTDSEIDEPITY